MAEELQGAFQKYGFKAGFLKLTLLKLVSKSPVHGYALMKEIERITNEEWKPSPGSIYPALQELVEDGLITCALQGRRKVYEITPQGSDALEVALRHAEEAIKRLNRLLSL
ncbi:MAG: PadR family transcriptional regulator [Methanomassiliicoccales archaeon]|nr:PadR family transcriptional regulator [Methanomassiliicoccales archaeon]